eukprot:g8170.t1
MRDTVACFNNTPAAFQVDGGGTLALDGFPTPGSATQVMGTAASGAILILRNVPDPVALNFTAAGMSIAPGLCTAYTVQTAKWKVSAREDAKTCQARSDRRIGAQGDTVLADDDDCFSSKPPRCDKSAPWGVDCSPCPSTTVPTNVSAAAAAAFPYLGAVCECPAGHAGSACTPCQPGYFFPAAKTTVAAACSPCTAGQYQDEAGKSACQFQADEERGRCDRCPDGKFARSQGADRCEAAVALGSAGAIADAHPVVASSFALQGFTTETFREQEQKAFIESVAAELGVDPADIVITAVAAPAGTRRRLSHARSARQLSATGAGIIVTFEVKSSTLLPVEPAGGAPAAANASNGTGPQFSDATQVKSAGVAAKLRSTGFAATMVTRLHTTMAAANLAVPPGLNATLAAAPSAKRAVCGPGFFFEGAGVTAQGRCAPCPAGKFKPAAGSADATCRACEPHTVSGPSATRCLACSEGKYQSRRGQPFCQVCPPNAEYSPAAPAAAPCVCTAKYFECPANTSVAYQPGQDCGDSHLAASERQKHAGACITCDTYAAGADCSAPGSSLATLKSRRGFWRATTATATFHACNPLNKGECRGGAIPANGTRDTQCAKGHAGPKCEPCDRDHDPAYVRKFGGVCGTCAPGEGVGVMLVAPAAVLSLVAFAWFLYRYHAAKLRGLNGWVTKRTIKTRI